MSTTLDHELYTGVLAELARDAQAYRFSVAPNPCVGAAVLSRGQVLARGFHEVWGGEHAEARALDVAESSGVADELWDTLVVTLEPCSSQGKTPPCVDRILQAGIGRVVVGAQDPDPRHRGRGIELLREAGIEVSVLDRTPLTSVAPHFLRWLEPDRLRRPQPWTIAKWAQTRTGQLIPPEDVGGGRWISGPAALVEVQMLRARVDAIVTGIGTVLADNPRLTVRPPAVCEAAPARIVLDSHLRTPVSARLFDAPEEGVGAGPVHVLGLAGAAKQRHRELVEAGAEVHELRGSDTNHLMLRNVQEWMWERGFRRVLIEAGPHLLSSYLETDFVDQVRVYTGQVNGGQGDSVAEHLTRLRLEGREDRELDGDSVLEAFVV